MLVAQSCLSLCDPVGCSRPGSFVHGILQARILKCFAISFSRGSSWPRNRTRVSCITGRFFIIWAIGKPIYLEVPDSFVCTDILLHIKALSPPGFFWSFDSNYFLYFRIPQNMWLEIGTLFCFPLYFWFIIFEKFLFSHSVAFWVGRR